MSKPAWCRRQQRGGEGQEQRDREALEQHFASIQGIPEQKTMPTLLPSLQAALMRAADTAPLKDQLRCRLPIFNIDLRSKAHVHIG
jgi:hypothetical protein